MLRRWIFPGLVLASVVLAGCAGMNTQDALTLKQDVEGDPAEAYRQNYSLAVMNANPKVLVAIPKNQTGKLELKQKQKDVRAFGGTQEVNKDKEIAKNDTTVTTGSTNENAGYDGIFGKLTKSQPDDQKPQIDSAYDPQHDLTMPVISAVYGGPVTIIKSVNGGFGMILLKQGAEQNMMACQALFKALPAMSSGDIEKAAMNADGMFRPTYWLDNRAEKKVPKAELITAVAKEPDYMPYLTFTSTGGGQSQLKQTEKGDTVEEGCKQRLPHYNFALSHTLLNRLGVLEKRGPFLVAWQENSGKAMILDMSSFEARLDFDEAVETWTKMIVRHPKVWEAGMVQQASVKQHLRRILNKGGKSILSLLNPSGTEAHASN